MSEMLQRVADVITERANPDRDGGIEGEYAISLARHVIAAMRDLDHEADAEMLIRGHAMVGDVTLRVPGPSYGRKAGDV